MEYKTFQILKEEDKSAIASLWEQYAKAATGEDDLGSFKVIATSDDIDRDGEVIALDGWEFDNYNKNPVVLWGHDFYSMPIGKVTLLTRDGNKIIAEGVFAPTEKGQEARKAYDGEFLNTVSVGFIPREKKGNTITKAELLELSFVPVPANANAVAVRAMEELSIKMMKKDAAPDEKPEEAKADADVEAGEDEEKKGIVADVADAMGVQDGAVYTQKWGNLSQVNQIVGALYEVYTRPEIGVDDFDGLLKEVIDLLGGVLGARASSDGKIAEAMKSIDGPSLTKAIAANFDTKSGRVLSSKNRSLIGDAVKALQDLLDSTDESDDGKSLDPEKPTDEDDDSSAKGRDLDIEEITTAVLRGIDKAVGKELRNIKRGE